MYFDDYLPKIHIVYWLSGWLEQSTYVPRNI